MVKTNYLSLSWSTSRGRDTYGYNIARLDDMSPTGRRHKCMGGGYDMVGTCIGQWLMSAYAERLLQIQGNADTVVSEKFGRIKNPGDNRFYGMTHYQKDGRVYLDGACGLDCMIRIAAAIGVRITSNYNRRANRGRGATEGYFVTDFGTAEALRAAEEVQA